MPRPEKTRPPLMSGRGTASSSALQSAPAVWLAKVEEVRVVARPSSGGRPSEPGRSSPPRSFALVLLSWLWSPSCSAPARLWYPPWVCIEWRKAAPRVPRAWRSGKRREQALVPRLPAMDSHRQLDPEAPRGSGDCLQWGWPQAGARSLLGLESRVIH